MIGMGIKVCWILLYNISSMCVLNFIWKYHHLIIVCEFTRKCCKTITVADSMFTHDKLCIKLYTVNLDSRDISYEI